MAFRNENGLELIDSTKLVKMIRDVNPNMTNDQPVVEKEISAVQEESNNTFPCGGNQFYGCSNFPKCKYTQIS